MESILLAKNSSLAEEETVDIDILATPYNI